MSGTIQFSREFSRRYKVIAQLGRGGAGMVFRAVQKELRRTVALKLVDPELFEDDVAMQRFAQEARVTAEIHHPNVLQVIETGVDKGPGKDLPYIVYELVDGSDLGTTLEKNGGRLPPEKALRTMISVLRGLAAAHARQPPILHRDIKPDNVLISSSGEVKVADFGIAKRKGQGPRTQTGMVVGTPTYMSPEQAQGLELGNTSDLYSTAVMTFECLVGRPPFQADSGMEVAVMHVRDEPPAASSLHPGMPPEIDRILSRALDKNPRNRYQSAGEFADVLEGACKAWPIWVKRMHTAEIPRESQPLKSSLTDLHAAKVEAGEATRPMAREAMAPAVQIQTVAPAPERLTVRTLFERSYLALVGTLLGVFLLLALWLGGFLGGTTPEDLAGRYEPAHVRGDAGCMEATVRWESREKYPSRIRYRRVGTSGRFLSADAPGGTPTDSHRVDLDTLLPGAEYEYFVLFPDGNKSLRYSFRTQELRFLRYPTGRILEGGTLEVSWKLNLEARAVLRARQVSTSGNKTRTKDLRRYQQEVTATIPGWGADDEVEFMVLFYSEWWDKRLAEETEARNDPELYLPWISVASLTSEKRAARDKLAGVLRSLPGSLSVLSLENETDAEKRASGKVVQAAAVDADYFSALRGFEGDLLDYFRSDGVDWTERRAWVQDVTTLHDWVQGLDARGIPNSFVLDKLYPEGLRPLGGDSRLPSAFLRKIRLEYEDQEDPDFRPRVTVGRLLPTRPLSTLPRLLGGEVAIEVADLDPGEVVLLDLGGGYQARFRAPREAPGDGETTWLYHQVPLERLPVPVEIAVGMYTAPGSEGTNGVEVRRIELRGRPGK